MRKEKEFDVGSIHINVKGPYIIDSVDRSKASIRYADGMTASLRVDVLKRIEGEITECRESELQASEAEEYLRKNDITVESADPLIIYLHAYEHAERQRILKLNKERKRKANVVAEGKYRAYPKTARVTCCYSCKTNLDSRVQVECNDCSWMICPKCGACGCTYGKS
jgi:hypothetical protein